MDELNKYIEKENQLKNLTSLNLSAATDSVAKSMALERVRVDVCNMLVVLIPLL